MSPRAGEAPPLPHPLPRVSAAVRLRRRSLGAGGWRKTGRQRRTRREGPTQARPGLRTATAQPFVKHEFLAPAQGVSHFWEIAEIKGGRLPSRNAADRAQTIHRKRSCFLKSRSHFPRKSEARDVNETYLIWIIAKRTSEISTVYSVNKCNEVSIFIALLLAGAAEA
jgi:hypothetical protein